MTRRVVLLFAVLALGASACGARGDVEEADPVADVSENTGTAQTSGTGGDADQAMFGTTPSPCGPTPEGMVLTDGEQGITADSITVGTISDPGGPVPGLNQGIFDSMNAFAAWCNDQGGINGRELIVEELDAAVLQYKERILEACDSVFALVGGGGALDELGAQETVDCGLVDVAGYTVSPQKADSDLMYQPQPNPIDRYSVGGAQWMADENPEAIKKAAALYSKIATTEKETLRLQEAYEQVGFEFVYEAAANINEVNWAPLVVAMRNAGVEYVTLTSSWEEGVNLQKAMVEQGFEPVFVDFQANYYNAKYPAAAGSAADGTYVRITVWPFEEADENPAMQQYLAALRKAIGDDVVPEMLGVQSWSAGLLFATAAEALGADVTRDGLLDELSTITEWDGGGLHGPNNPAENENAGCFILMQVVDGGFERVYPDEGFDCGAENGVDVTPQGEGARVKAASGD